MAGAECESVSSSIEINLSATESALTLIPHYRPFPYHHANTFKVETDVNVCPENTCVLSLCQCCLYSVLVFGSVV